MALLDRAAAAAWPTLEYRFSPEAYARNRAFQPKELGEAAASDRVQTAARGLRTLDAPRPPQCRW